MALKLVDSNGAATAREVVAAAGGPKKIPMSARNDMVLVEMDGAPDMSKGGILLVKGTGKYARRGTVRSVGPGLLCEHIPGNRMPMDLKEGDRVYLADEMYRCELEDGDDRWVLVPQGMIPGLLPKE